MSVRNIMRSSVLTVAPRDTLVQADAMMRDHDIRHLPVCAGASLVGILSARDLAFASALGGRATQQTQDRNCGDKLTVQDVMTRNPAILRPDDSLVHAMQIAIYTRYGAFPVMERGRLVGIVSVVDLLKASLDGALRR